MITTEARIIRASDPMLEGGMNGNEAAELEDRARQWPAGSDQRAALGRAAVEMADWIDEKAMASMLGNDDARRGWDR